ncbi:MAG TPA: hydrogenase maturation protease [Verrucomicrobiota bacterium]|nr:hydrogenase maturation protease [Verrucomicrobiota bacterium]
MTALRASPIAIAGLGNLLCSDDGVGIHAVRLLKSVPMDGVDIVEVGTAVLHAVDCLANAERILLLDAVRAGRPPGTICCFDADLVAGPGAANGSQDDTFASANNPSHELLSVHSLGLREAFCLLSPERQPRFTVIGVEPGSIAYGTELTPEVADALPRLVAVARSIAWHWLGELAALRSESGRQTRDGTARSGLPLENAERPVCSGFGTAIVKPRGIQT